MSTTKRGAAPAIESYRRKLRGAVHASPLTQREIARRLEVAQPTLHQWLHGRDGSLSIESLDRLGGVLGVDFCPSCPSCRRGRRSKDRRKPAKTP